MAYIDFKRIERVVKLDKTVFKEIRDDKNALGQALVVLLVAAKLGSIWSIISTLGVFLVIIVIAAPIGWVIWTGILHIIAKLFGGKATYTGYLKVMGYAEAPMALGVIPIVGSMVGGLWSLVLAVYATKDAQEISMGKAIAVIMIPVAIVVILSLLFSMLMMGMLGALSPVSSSYY